MSESGKRRAVVRGGCGWYGYGERGYERVKKNERTDATDRGERAQKQREKEEEKKGGIRKKKCVKESSAEGSPVCVGV